MEGVEGFRPCWATALLLLKSEADYSESGGARSKYRDYYALGLITIPNMNANWPLASRSPGVYVSQLPVRVSLGLLITSVRGRIGKRGDGCKGCRLSRPSKESQIKIHPWISRYFLHPFALSSHRSSFLSLRDDDRCTLVRDFVVVNFIY